ncbi:DUF885 domain-containing protein [Nevskia soli]|uniref:DUF885 domain-containing protein n=1 Tax=Nevskia soli TaxID=418856 RepID=UPI0015D8CD8B|nr:DUF885 domain-containing protein [Nevskia soli]
MKFLLLATLGAGALSAQGPLYDRYFSDYYFRFNPTAGTASGFHQYDKQLEDYSAAGVQTKITALHGFEAQFAKEPASPDRDLVLSRIRADLLEYESVKMWQKNPDFYSSGVTGSIFTIMSRKFAPQSERLESVIAREKQIPAALEDARRNLRNPPRVYTEVAIEQLPGITGFFEKDVPLAFNEVTDPDLNARFKASNQAVIDSLNKYLSFLKTDLLPRSNGDFRIGAENYRKKLLYEEMVDIPLDRLLTIGYSDLRKNQEAFRKVAAEIDPNRTPQQILDDLEKDHPPASGLLQSFRDILSGLKAFIEQHQIIDIPSPVLPIVEETPPFERALTTASMDTPGPYEKVATEAFFNVTLPNPADSAKDTEEYMESFNRGTIASTAIHEAYPGHYVQFLWVQHAPNQVRKLLGAGSNAEGWAHYCEQMMLDEGYGDKQLRIGQLQDALLRNARYIAGIEMHTGKMTMDQAREFFVKEGYQTKPIADKETKRGTSDPTYLMYTLGKLEIMKLRADYKAKMGDKFTLKEFHDNFMKQGFPPIKIVREAMLGPDSGPTL